MTFSDLLYEVIKINENIIQKPPYLSIREIATCDDLKEFTFTSSHQRCSMRNFTKFTRKYPCQSLSFNSCKPLAKKI